MKLHEANQLAITLMKEHGLINWSFEFDNSISRFGCTHWNTKTISLSKALTELNNIDNVKDTILHEIAHAIQGARVGHGVAWQQTASSIGCNGSRLYDSDKVITPPHKYNGICPNGHTSQRNKKMKVSCSRCCPLFNKKYMIKYIVNPEYK